MERGGEETGRLVEGGKQEGGREARARARARISKLF